jgi:hypothetical protein
LPRPHPMSFPNVAVRKLFSESLARVFLSHSANVPLPQPAALISSAVRRASAMIVTIGFIPGFCEALLGQRSPPPSG